MDFQKSDPEVRGIDLMVVFGALVYNMSAHSPIIEFRLPKVEEEVFVQHGFFRNGKGTVKSVDPDSKDEKVVITIHGKADFDVPYSYGDNSTHWECMKGSDRIDSGASIAVYVGDEKKIDPGKFIFLYPPIEEARQYWSQSRKYA